MKQKQGAKSIFFDTLTKNHENNPVYLRKVYKFLERKCEINCIKIKCNLPTWKMPFGINLFPKFLADLTH